MATRQPAVFFGHGSPMRALAHDDTTEAWHRLALGMPRPRGILAISAHWYGPGTAVTAQAAPPTIHDFGGFPRELYEIQYPAPGDPVLAARVQRLLAPIAVEPDDSWGLDHGTWSVLRHAYPNADIPVVQLSIDATKPAEFHFEAGRALAPLRDEGVLIAGSGNVIHNLRAYAWGRPSQGPYDWAVRFENRLQGLIGAREYARLIHYEALGPDAVLSIPTPDHYLPLLYVLGASQSDEAIRFPVSGIEGGSLSMLAVQVG
ncbi:4,5-DOPA dioxygenase extradiol [Acidiferrobacter sp.]|uniref:4,5-DOPA-extradiol-dioxygenase n=1 Tax=Acidiferrobacter sp. TaxID=1872107 RepID=UPI002622854D|nr:4,5-DOPA dioxygenase extradiol [Acidiferrobacter sp.]